MESVLAWPSRSLRNMLGGRSWFDWLYAVALIAGAAYAMEHYGAFMDGYEKAILVLAVPVFATLGWRWSSIRPLLLAAAVISLLTINLYQGDLERAEQVFLLKYFVSSQSAIMWMSVLFFLSTGSYWAGMLSGSSFAARSGTTLAWAAVLLGLSGMLVRWYESYLIGPDIGHIPISNLYEVFVLFSLVTSLFYLYYEQRYETRQLGAFVMVVVSAAVGFLLWYTFEREAQEIQPLVPALQSWWMKIHVPANFIGYGTFSLAAMTGFAYLVKDAGGGFYLFPPGPGAVGRGPHAGLVAGARGGGVPQDRFLHVLAGLLCRVRNGIRRNRRGAPDYCNAAAGQGTAGGPDVQVHYRGLCLFHHRDHPRRPLGRGSMGLILVLGPERDLGAHRLAELCGLAAHAPAEGPARLSAGLVGADRLAGDDVCLPRREHVSLGAAFLRAAVVFEFPPPKSPDRDFLE